MGRGRCDACGKTFRIPETGRTYKCKACGGTVHEMADEPGADVGDLPEGSAPGSGEETCGACGAIAPSGARYCEECGAEIGAAPLKSRLERDEDHRHDARLELLRAFKWIKLLRFYYWFFACVWGLIVLGMIFGLSSPDADAGAAAVTIAIGCMMVVLTGVGALQIPFQPLVWSVLLAAVVTLEAAAETLMEIGNEDLTGDGPDPVTLVFRIAWVAAFWFGVMPMVRARRLMQQHPDLYISRRIQGVQTRRVRRNAEGRTSASDARSDMSKAVARARKQSAILGAGVFLFAIMGSTLARSDFLSGSGDARAEDRRELPSLDPTLELFEAAWHRGDAEAIAELFLNGSSPRRIRSIEKIAEKRSWTGGYANLGDRQLEERRIDSIRAYYVTPDGVLMVSWRYDEEKWRITGLDPPK